jgi:hypothetical protein
VQEDWANDPTLIRFDPATKACWRVHLDRPYWNDVTLQIAEAVRQHLHAARITIPSWLAGHLNRPEKVTEWLADLRAQYPVVTLELADEKFRAETKRGAEAAAASHRRRGSAILYSLSPQTLHAALTAYGLWVGRQYVELGGEPTQWSGVKSRHIEFIRQHAQDIPLCDFDTAQIDAVLDVLRKRPASRKTGRPIKSKTAKNVIKEFRQFLRWVHKSPEWEWSRPWDYEVTPVKIVVSSEERSIGAAQVATYSVSELRLLWQYAQPFERVLLLLGLNCGFGRAEVSTLSRGEVFLHTPNPAVAKGHDRPGDRDESWVMRCRGKNGVFGIWKLWPITVGAVEWWLARRPDSEDAHLLLRETGGPLAKRTTGGRQNSLVANRWARLTERIRKDHPSFSVRSFGKIRKTSADLIRLEAGGEIASIQLSHGVPFKGDSLVEAYTNKPFTRLHEVLDAIGRSLEPVWQSVADPFPGKAIRGGPNISRGTIQRIVELHDAGQRIVEIVKETGVARETVRRWVNRHLAGGKKSE